MDKFRVLSLMTTTRGGSKFFHSLLDWHPQIICFPRTLQFNRFWQGVAYKSAALEYLVDSFIAMNPRFFSGESWYRFNKYDRADQLGPMMNESFSVDVDIFREKAINELKNKDLNRYSLFVALHLAYHAACGRELAENSVILYHIHDVAFEDELRACLSDFPDTRLLIMTRHPIEGLNSCVNWMKMQNTLSCNELLHHNKQALHGIENIVESFPDLDIRILPFEQLHIHHREVMETFVNWIGIKWHESLMISTMHGKLWWGNGKLPRNGTNPRWKIYQPSGILEKNDWRIFCSLIYNRMKMCGYLVQSQNDIKLKRYNFLISLLLPTASEWLVLKSALSPRYWIKVIQMIIKEENDPRLKGFDFYSKKELPKDKGISIFSLNFRIFFSNRIFKKLCFHIYMLNSLVWLYYFLKRIIYYYQFDKKYSGKREQLVTLLMDNDLAKREPIEINT